MADDRADPNPVKRDGGVALLSAFERPSAALLRATGDVLLLLDRDGRILDATAGGVIGEDDLAGWIGRPFADVVTVESKPKVEKLIADGVAERPPHWRQVNHLVADGELPVRYACVAAGGELVAVGRDMRADAALQQRLLQAQQSLERDYLRLRQAEARYRMLFDLPDEPTLVIETATWRIAEANAAAHRLLGVTSGALARQPVGMLVEPAGREAFLAQLGAASAGAAESRPLIVRTGAVVTLSVAPFRQDRATFLLLRLLDAQATGGRAGEHGLRRVVEQMPDAFVLTGRSLAVVAANGAFLDMAQAASLEQVVGQPLATWLGRPGVDVDLIVAELRKSGVVRNISTVVRNPAGTQEEVELSAVLVEAEGEEHFGFVLRNVGRRLRDLPPSERDQPRSVDQLTELVGRLSLKEIVRESTDLIERLCIEAALAYTADNRASAAELLGLSRQGLYSKLHRHRLGGLIVEDE